MDREGKAFGFVSEALEVLDTKQTLGVFPEGRLPVGGKPFPFTVSTAFIATHADSLIVPVYTDGNYGLLKRCNVVIGEAFDLKAYCKEGLSEQQQLEQLSNAPTADAQEVALLRAELEESMSIRTALEARCAGLERELEAAQAAPNVPQVSEAMELEAYRRAERMEREARERAEQIYHRTNGILADATCRVDAVTGALNGAADAFITQLNQLQEAVDASRQALQEAARTMGELRPEEG